MLVKSVFTVISVYETKFARKNFSEISDTKGGEPIFQVWGGGKKKGGNQIFSKILGGEPKPYTLYVDINWSTYAKSKAKILSLLENVMIMPCSKCYNWNPTQLKGYANMPLI